MQWFSHSFKQLDTQTLYDILRLRVDVFVVEQTCYYPELDGLDCLDDSIHLYAVENGEVLAYLRCLSPGVAYDNDSAIGRVLTSKAARGTGIGHELLRRGIEACEKAWPNHAIHLSAQEHLQNYYAKQGFKTVTEMYLEDEIPHIGMLRPLENNE